MTLIGNIVGVGYGGGVSEFLPPFAETLYRQESEGDPLKDATGTGPDLPYVSGFGVDQIFDFSPLADNRWNKNAYIGNAFALPGYYDFPYSAEIYFDTVNPFHWKIKDCHYRYYEEQADSVTNISFAKLTYDDFGYGAKNTSSGIIYKEETQAYGEWEFLLSRVGGLTQSITFISQNNQVNNEGYSFIITDAGAILFRVYSGGAPTTLFSTVSGYLSHNRSDVYLKVVRNSVIDEFVTGAVGTFAVYIKGDTFGANYVLITTSSGSNPVTNNDKITATHTVFSLNTGYSIRNYTINGTLQDFNDFTQSTGTYEIDRLKSSDELLLYQEGKGLDCTTSGVAYQASTDAYGEWEFNLKHQDTRFTRLNFISDNTNAYPTFTGYSLTLASDEAIYLIRTNGAAGTTILKSATGYIEPDVSYSIKIVRNSIIDEYVTGSVGTFAIYIKGGSFGSSYVLVDTTGGSGTNPITDNTYTTSAYTVLDLDAGDNIANYSINGTLLDTRDFTQTTGEYVVTSELEDPELTQIKSFVRLLPTEYLYYRDELPPIESVSSGDVLPEGYLITGDEIILD